ncbi:MAG TPA: folylpolyglutamate synthase/dihydrofolate synthase family protein [Planctomycetota bacterium]|nr:folylpolyglutamate synthase/dihydrofolate synthase family protein [Planctomycetota bacterium]
MIRSYPDALAFLKTFTDYERMASVYTPGDYNLERMRRLLSAVGNPERAFLSLHIAGTKGKGSTAHLAEALLREAGYRTGLYTSPHLIDLRERIRLDGTPIREADFTRVMATMEPQLRRLKPTYFETMTAVAFLAFAEQGVDYAVVEVGLGGRLDATNVLRPAACAITTIDYDHMDKLGHTLEAIAGEKAGILKPGVPAVSSPQAPAARRVLNARGPVAYPRFRVLSSRGFVLKFTVEGRRYDLPVLGEHQAANAATALALVERSGAIVSPGTARRAFRKIRLPGRVERVGRRPTMIVDAAHNPVSARALAAALESVPRRRLLLVFGASADKDYRSMLRTLLPAADLAIFTKAASPRAAAPSDLMKVAKGRPAVAAGSVARALALARKAAGPEDAIVVTGSFYVAGEALGLLKFHE